MLVDTFMFYNEFDVLELRLMLLDKYVDRFVLVESEVTHAGGPKELFFHTNRERYAKWLSKIVHVIVTADESPKDSNPWAREKYQRHCILKGLEAGCTVDGTPVASVPDEAIVMISDVDEIPDMTKVPWENLPHSMASVHMWMFEYSCDYVFTGEPWFGTVLTTCKLMKAVGPNRFREGRWKFPTYQYAGWHLSSFGDGKHVYHKIQTYAHAKDADRTKETPELYEYYIQNRMHHDGKQQLIVRPPEVPLPAPVEVLQRLGLGTFP
jgi:beta-1,4-mannosyl-glycoprotein beta-1,4-N-acetylglucosaminyltransferase